MKKILLAFGICLLLIFAFSSCDDDNVDPSCDCVASAPWSKPGITDCYGSKSDCEAAEGGTCVICN